MNFSFHVESHEVTGITEVAFTPGHVKISCFPHEELLKCLEKFNGLEDVNLFASSPFLFTGKIEWVRIRHGLGCLTSAEFMAEVLC